MSSKFDAVPVEADTTILFQVEAKLGEYEVLYQKWYWEGITAESVIFANDDVTRLTDDQLKQEVGTSPLVNPESQITLTRSDSGYTFVNFNFVIDR